MLLRARILLPITAPPLEDGAVLISDGRIAAVGRWADLRRASPSEVVDLGEVVLMPGWVNAHCHLDYTRLAGHLPPPRSFSDWIQGVLGLKAGWSYSDYAASWLDGAGQLLRSGCTTVVDFEAVPELLPDVWNGTPLRVASALELTGVRGNKPPEILLGEALARIDGLRHARSWAALGPHAPYSTRPEFLPLCAASARARGLLTTMHVAESEEEYEMFRHARGPMHRWIARQRGAADCGVASPVRLVAEAGLMTPESLLVHVNYLDDGDEGRLARSGATVVHCPRSHDYFGHAPFPVGTLTQAGVPICVGTDSLLSVRRPGRDLPVLDLRRELAAFGALHPAWPPDRLLELATSVPGRFLGRWMGGLVGVLEPGAHADLVAFSYAGSAAGAANAMIHGEEDATSVLIGGACVPGPAESGTPAGPGSGKAPSA